MMKRNSKMIIGTILAIVIISFSTVVFAENTTPVIIGGSGSTTQNTEQNTTDNTTSNTTANTTYNALNTSTTYNTANTTTTLPKTGVADGYVVAILVGVCAVSAIYAYKKIRDYNVI